MRRVLQGKSFPGAGRSYFAILLEEGRTTSFRMFLSALSMFAKLKLSRFFGRVPGKDSGGFELAGKHRGPCLQKSPIHGKATRQYSKSLRAKETSEAVQRISHRTNCLSPQDPSDADRQGKEATVGACPPELRTGPQ